MDAVVLMFSELLDCDWSAAEERCVLCVLAAGVSGGEGGRGALLFDGGEFSTFMMNETETETRLKMLAHQTQAVLSDSFPSVWFVFSVVYSGERARVGTAHEHNPEVFRCVFSG